MGFLSRIGIAAKIGTGSALLVALLIAVGIVAYQGLNRANSIFTEYRQLARQNNALGRVQANMVEIRLHALKYLLEDKVEWVHEVEQRAHQIGPLVREARLLFEDREALDVLNLVEEDGQAYVTAFYRMVRSDLPTDGPVRWEAGTVSAGDRLPYMHDTLDRLGPAVDAALERLKLANLQRQDGLGPRALAELERASATAVTVAVLAILLGTVVSLVISAAITRPVGAMTRAMGRLAEGDLEIEIPAREHRDEIGAMAKALQVFQGALRRMERQRILRAHAADISTALQLAVTPAAFAHALFDRLAPPLEAGLAILYVRNEGGTRFRAVGGYACAADLSLLPAFAAGEGLPGQCVASRAPLIVQGLPEDAWMITSGLSTARPDTVACIPVVAEEGVLGVIEIARYGRFTDTQLELIEQVTPVVALNLGLLERNLRTSDLLAQTSVQAEELRLQTEELQASEDELRVQREELQAANEALEDKTRSLERQAVELEEARREADRRAAQVAAASEYKSQFLANMSHELRTPLNSILILAQTLAENDAGNLLPDQIESAEVIGESGNHLLSLINDILDLSKIEAGKLDLLPEDFRLDEVFALLARSFAPAAAKKGITLETVLSPGMPLRLHTDRQRLTQVLFNLVGNAVKFTERGGVRLSAERREDGGLVLSVGDTGPGIPADRIDHIFGAFHQLDGTTSRRYGGTGLGLAICKRLVELMGGSIAVASTPGAGSVFSVTLPAAAVGEAGEADAAPEPMTPAAAAGRGVLVAAPDRSMRELLSHLIRSLGLSATDAGTGAAALQALAAERPAAVLLDLDLPDLPGLEALRRIKADPHGATVPVTILSADPGVMGAARTLGAMGRIAKPATRDEVVAALSAMLGVQGETERRRLLVVEDNAVDALALEKLFRPDALDMVVARSGEEALHRLADGRFDAVVLDLMLPDMSGFALLEKVWKEPGHHPPVIVYSAHDLTAEDVFQLRSFAESVVVKGRGSSRLREEVLQALDDPREPAEAPPAEPPAGLLTGRRVLLVDDDMRNLVALSRALRQRGLEVEVASDGPKALALLEAGRFDVVLTDVMMPGMDGLELIRRIRARSTGLPVIAVTAKAMKGDAEQCLEAGANGYLAKPLDLGRLMETLERCLS